MGATSTIGFVLSPCQFQSTRPRWARPGKMAELQQVLAFQSTRPRWARPRDEDILRAISIFQSTRPRWARRAARPEHQATCLISIHAPAMGATANSSILSRVSRNFNPRARDGRDYFARQKRQCSPDFNPRARDGRDIPVVDIAFLHRDFNPRARDGRDQIRMGYRSASRYFNPRARDGRDCMTFAASSSDSHFNPRARDGRDVAARALLPAAAISIHAPAMGATTRALADVPPV